MDQGNGNILKYTEWEEVEGDINDKKSIAYFKNSVFENGGFYMGRYEMGMPGQKSGDDPVLALNSESRNINGTPVCIANVMPWNYIDWDTAKENLESMYNGEVQSAMLNSYARTTTVNWIGGNIDGNMSDTFWPPAGETRYFKGNYIITNYLEDIIQGEANEYTNGVGALGGSPSGESILLETATTVRFDGVEKRFVCNNIYDLVGNAGEWSTEKRKDSNLRRISGGSFTSSYGYMTDGNLTIYRAELTGSISTSSRPILYK